MQDVYQWKKDKKILLYEEGNQIQVQIIRAGRNIQWGVLCRDCCLINYPVMEEWCLLQGKALGVSATS